MSNVWVYSDPHFNHQNIIRYCDRPFKDAYEMNEVLIARYNDRVKGNDKVYFLGDVYFGGKNDAEKILARLNGKKRLILGNHDNLEDGVLKKYFQRIYLWRVFRDEKMIFSHIPLHPNQLGESINVHGHIHEKLMNDPKYVNACVEHSDYAPIPFEEIRTWKSLRPQLPDIGATVENWGPKVSNEILEMTGIKVEE
jgi:calcineurin-like phosphoesterase family protein